MEHSESDPSSDSAPSSISFQTERPVTPGATIRILLRFAYADPGNPLSIQCEGRVARVEECEGFGMVATITSLRIVPPASGEPA